MNRREFIRAAGTMTTGLSLGMASLKDLWAKLPSKIKITGLKTLIVEDEVYLKVLTDQGIVGEGHTTVHQTTGTSRSPCAAATTP